MIPNYPLIKTTWTDRTNGLQDVMASDVNQLYAETIAVENALTSINTLITSFYLSTDISANDMIERALASGPTYTNLLLPAGTYTIIRPIVIPDGVSFCGVGGATVLQPDFSKWQKTYVNGVLQYDYRVFIVRGGDNPNGVRFAAYNYAFANRIIGDFSISALNGNLVSATGLYAGTDQIITCAQAINYAIQDTCFRNIYIERLDTAYHFKECDDSIAINMNAMYCRHGVDIIGKMINFSIRCNFQNFSIAYTSNTGTNMVGITVDQFTYSDIVGRPEGIFFLPGTLVYGANNDVCLNNVLQCTFNNCMLDGASQSNIIVQTPDGYAFNECYISSSTITLPIINLNGLVGSTALSKQVFNHCEIVGIAGTGTLYGIMGVYRFDLDIIECDFQFCNAPMWFNNCHAMNLINNHGHNNYGVFIYIQSAGDNCIVDGNKSEDSYKILKMQPYTLGTLTIGNNVSVTSSTFMRGKAVILANTSTITVQPFGSGINSILNTDYIYPSVRFSLYNDAVHIISWAQNNNTITFTTSVQSTSPITIYYEINAVPYISF